jgi:hypothetical protein
MAEMRESPSDGLWTPGAPLLQSRRRPAALFRFDSVERLAQGVRLTDGSEVVLR